MAPRVVRTAANRRYKQERRAQALAANIEDFLGDERKEAAQAAKAAASAKKWVLQEQFWKYDTNHSQLLNDDQLRALLTDLDTSSPEGTVPTDSELAFIRKVADKDADGKISFEEFEDAVFAWSCYTEKRDNMAAAITEFDKSGTGKLELAELRQYLTKLNGGKEVTEDEAKFVLEEADYYGDGAIGSDEIVMATAVWYQIPPCTDVAKKAMENAEEGVDKALISAPADGKPVSSCACTIL